MSRARSVDPEVIRLFLGDVAKSLHQKLLDQTGDDKATPEQISASEARMAQAIEDGDFIVVKKILNAGETRQMLKRMAKTITPGEGIQLDTEQVGLAKVVEYLVSWSFVDPRGKPLPMDVNMSVKDREKAINGLHQDDMAEVLRAVEWHEDEQSAVRDAEKNGTDGGSGSSATSPSPNTTAGDTSGLTNLTQTSSTS